MRAAKYLGQIRRLDAHIDAKIAERQRVMDLATRITPTLSDAPGGSGGVSDRVGDAVAKLLDLDIQINQAIDRLVDVREEILDLLEMLPPEEYRVLHAHFVRGMTFAAIAEDMKPRPLTERQVHRIKGRALKRMQAMLDSNPPASIQRAELEALRQAVAEAYK